MTTFLGVILAGGLSRRMDGVEKSFLELGGKPLIDHVAERLGAQVPELLINANGNPQRFSALNLPVQADTIEGFAGPLAGILAGMRWAIANSSASHIVTAAADTPFFPEDYVERMDHAKTEEGVSIVLASSNDRRHPVFGLWPVELADALEAFLVDEENRKVMMFVDRYTHCKVEFAANHSDPFFNVNTPDDLASAEELARELAAT